MQTGQIAIGRDHPDLVLLQHEARRGICCLVVRGADDAQLRELAAGAFYICRQGECGAVLFSQDCGFEGAARLEEQLERMNLQGGLSGPFALAASARGCMLKAQLALQTGERLAPGRALYRMDEFVEAALLEACACALGEQGFIAEDFCDAALANMRAMDEQKDTRYAESLHAYLRCGMDLKRAAQELGVHRNTLAYRMERLQAIFGVDLKDVSRCFELLFSLWLSEAMPSARAAADRPYDRAAAQAALWRYAERSGAKEKDAPRFSCVLIAAGVQRLADHERSSLITSLIAKAPPSAAVAFDESVLFAVCAPQDAEAMAAAAQAVCVTAGCPVVATQPFDAQRMAQRAKLCRMALCTGAGAFTRTRDICSTLLFMAVERCVSLAPYLCEDVMRVMDDDAQKGTFLSRSLYVYLLYFRDLRRAAQQIGMHRNTMEYHVRKIEALIGSDPDGSRRFMMMCTYKMLALPEMSEYGAR